MTGALRSSTVARDYLQEAQSLLSQVGKDFQSLHEVIDLTQLDPNFADQLDSEYRKFGTPFIFFIREYLKVERLKAACQLAAESEPGDFRWVVQQLALAKFGRGGPHAISYLAYMTIVNSSPLLVHLRNTIDRDFEWDSACFSHPFILLGISAREVKAAMRDAGWHVKYCFELLARKKGVILDLFLRVVSPLSKYETEARPLLDYVEQWGLHFFAEVEEVPAKQVRGLLTEADKVHEMAQAFLPEIMLGKKHKKMQTFAMERLHKDLVPTVIDTLDEMFPTASWRVDIGEDLGWTLATRGTQQQLVKILSPLEQLGEQGEMRPVELQDRQPDHELVLKNCYPYAIQLRSYFSMQVQKFDKNLLSLVISYL